FNSEGNVGVTRSYSQRSTSTTTIENLYDLYALNTIGAIEQAIKADSNGQFDTIRPYFTNGVPDYRFVNSEDIELTKQLSPLYSPIVVSPQHYQELVRAGYSKSEIVFDLNNLYLWAQAFNLNPVKRESGYVQKIEISNKYFKYTISEMIIQTPNGRIDVSSSDYVIEDGTIYFTKKISDILGIPLLSIIFGGNYDLHIYFDTIVPFEVKSQNIVTYDEQTLRRRVNTINYVDTIADNGRLALAQTLSYSISDYFNQYYIAATDANFRVQFKFTWITTLWSTLFSTLLLAPMAIMSSMASSGKSLGKTVASQLVSIPSAVVEEIWEELYLDPLVERYFYSRVQLAGGSEELATFVS
ncbi:hypothetical protein LCGC14_3049800, partial [marine sediment metagenome]